MSQSSIEYTDLGPVAPDSADVLQAQQDIWQAAFDNKLNPDPATPQGQLMASLAAIVQDKNSQLLFLANMFNPATSQGVYQDAIAAIYFITRQAAQATTVQVVCTGLPGTVIEGQDTSVAPARVRTADGTVLVCQTGGTIPAGGSITLPFAAQEPGPVVVEAHAVTTIVQAQPGWDTVANPDPGVTGRSTEGRQAFETRRRQSVALNSRSMLSSVYARVGNLPGVIDLLARQNRTDAPVEDNGVTLAPHSIYIAVLGGADADIAEAIYNSVSGGCDYNGDTGVEYTDPVTGAVETVRFQRPEEYPFAIEVTFQENATTPSDVAARVKSNILADFYGEPYPNAGDGTAHDAQVTRIPIGALVYASRFYCPAISAGASQLVSVQIGKKGGSLGNAVQLTNDQYPSLTADDITVIVRE